MREGFLKGSDELSMSGAAKKALGPQWVVASSKGEVGAEIINSSTENSAGREEQRIGMRDEEIGLRKR